MRQIEVNSSNVKVYFDLRSIMNYINPVLNELDSPNLTHPEISIDGDAWQTNHISQLVEIGNGRYYAILDDIILTEIGTVISTRYKSINTVETAGDSIEVVSTGIIELQATETINDSYVDLDEAESYFRYRLNSQFWHNSSDDNKNIALIQATRSIDNLSFKGTKNNDDQSLEFPRIIDITNLDDDILNDPNFIPDNIRFACLEIAHSLLSGIDIEKEIKTLYNESQTFAETKIVYNRTSIPEYLLAGIPSAIAWNYLKPYLSSNKTISISRVS